MPYQESSFFKTPGKSEPLWRYMHIDKFLAMLNSKSLYFPNIYSFNDKLEGTLSEKSRNEIRKISLLDEKNTLLDDDEAFYRKRNSLGKLNPKQENIESERIFTQLLKNFLSHLIYCNSWFKQEKESNAMWAEYGDKSPTSVAIQTTVGALMDSLNSNEYNIHIGKVEYKDYNNEHITPYQDLANTVFTQSNDVLGLFYAPFLHKRDVFRHENEVRAIISFKDISQKCLGRVYTSKIPFYNDPMFQTDVSELRDYNNPIENAENGIPINVNLDILLKKIVLSPYAKKFFIIHFENLIKRYDIESEIITESKLLDR